MKTPFFIAGFPRSKTAWFSNLFTWGNSFCYHDALHRCGISMVGEFLDTLDDFPTQVGHSCASNILIWDRIYERFPSAKWLLLERPKDEVLESCRKIISEVSAASLCVFDEKIEAMLNKIRDIDVVDVTNLSADDCYHAAEHLGVNIGPRERVTQLLDFNIQIHPPILQKRLASLMQKEAA